MRRTNKSQFEWSPKPVAKLLKEINLFGNLDTELFHWSDILFRPNAVRLFGDSWPSITFKLFRDITDGEMIMEDFWKTIKKYALIKSMDRPRLPKRTN